MKLQFRPIIGAILTIIGIFLIMNGVGVISFSATGSVTYQFHVTTSNGTPIAGASVTLQCTPFNYPFIGTTDSQGNLAIVVPDSNLPVLAWGISASGYIGQTGNGGPPNPMNIQLAPASSGTYYTLTLALQGNGTTDLASGSHSIIAGTIVTIHVQSGTLLSWTLDSVSQTSSTITATMNADHTITLTFSGSSPSPGSKFDLLRTVIGSIVLAAGAIIVFSKRT